MTDLVFQLNRLGAKRAFAMRSIGHGETRNDLGFGPHNKGVDQRDGKDQKTIELEAAETAALSRGDSGRDEREEGRNNSNVDGPNNHSVEIIHALPPVFRPTQMTRPVRVWAPQPG